MHVTHAHALFICAHAQRVKRAKIRYISILYTVLYPHVVLIKHGV